MTTDRAGLNIPATVLGPPAENYRILLIEDHPDHQLMEYKALKGIGAGTAVVAVDKALEGLETLSREDFDLVVADYQMPGMDGLEFLRTLNERQIKIPVVVVTGLGNERVAVAALKQGACDYIIKETGYLELLQSIAERAIASGRTQRQLDEARRRLAASEERYRGLVHGLDAIVWEADPTTWQFTFVSQRAEKILGYPVEQWLNEPGFWVNHIHPEDRERAVELCRSATAERRDHRLEYRTLTADGQVVWLRDIVRVACANGEVTSLQGLMVDVTEQKQAEEENWRLQQQLLQAQKMESIGTLAGGIAHDFNNLLQSVLGYATLALEYIEERSVLYGYLQTIIQSAERAAHLIKQMLAFSRRKEPQVEPVDVNRAVDESLQMLRHMIPSAIEIGTQLHPEVWTVMADATQLQQVLVNLCVNARDAMPNGGKLTLATENRIISEAEVEPQMDGAAGRYTVITVTDTGVGMTASVQERIFEPFFTTKGVGEGSGLGLAVAYGIIRSHQGWIKVFSKLGRGSVFKINLPAIEKAVATQAPAVEAVTGGSETILVADDEPMVLQLACEILRAYGYRTLTASNGEEAISVYRERAADIDLVLLDLTMPKLGGIECAKRLKVLNPTIRLVASSGYSAEARGDLGEEFQAFLPKPYSPRELVQVVRALLDAPRGSVDESSATLV